MYLLFQGRECVIVERLPTDELKLRNVATDATRCIREEDLVSALFEGQLTFLGQGAEGRRLHKKLDKLLVEDLNMLKDEDPRKIEVKRRLAYIKGIEAKRIRRPNPEALRAVIEEVHQSIGDERKIPHWKTVYYGWSQRFNACGRDLRVLVPGFKRQGNRQARHLGKRKRKHTKFTSKELELAREVQKVTDDVINEQFLTTNRITVQETQDRLEARIAEHNLLRDPGDKLPVPHRTSLYNRISKLDPYTVDCARFSKTYADEKHGWFGEGPRPTRPLERVEIDHTPLDFMVVDADTRLPLGRPTFTTMLDKCTRIVLGFQIGFDPPSALTVLDCLRHAIRPKDYLRELFPEVEKDWPAYGLPELIVSDNGPEFYSTDFEDACPQVGISVTYSPKKNPAYKGSIERFFGTHNRRLLHQQPGTTFSNIFDRGEYDPKKNAVISFDAFMEMIHIWIVDVYNQTPHRGLKDIPAQFWKLLVKTYPPALPQSMKALTVLLGHVEFRRVGPSGIELFTLLYNCEELALLRRSMSGGENVVKVKYDPRDLSQIWVYDAFNDRFIIVPALNQEYTKGLTLFQHDVIKNYCRKDLASRTDISGLIRAKQRIQDIVDREWNKGRKTGTRSKISRWKGIRQPDYYTDMQIDRQAADNGSRVEDLLLPLTGISDLGNALDGVRNAPATDDATTASEEVEHVNSQVQPSVISDVGEAEPDLEGFESSYSLPGRRGES
jgi:putative transposase